MPRAIKGGQIGANGEFYQGGQFINTVKENPKGKARPAAPSRPRKVMVAPYTWEFPPSPDVFPIYEIVGSRAGVNWRDKTIYMSPEGCDAWGATWKGYGVEELVARFNAGERWLVKK